MSLKHDGLVWISEGRSRESKSWKNKEVLWSQLVEKDFREVRRTKETVKEYAALPKDEQGRIKDVGGFVGGTITGGRRKKDAVATRTLLTLDIDFPGTDFVDDLCMHTMHAFALYSTHKHTAAVPRLRLILPLSREMQADEYEACARKFAEGIGIDVFDPTTFQPERLMYWPSCPIDGEFVTEYQDGPFIDPDVILKGYRDWKDISQWPQHPLEVKRRKDGIREQADPLLKTGTVGLFCRTYGIEAAIEKFLFEEYVKVEGSDDRFTYLHGSTAAGLIVYDDKFSYSWHGTDPTNGVLCNAFDLVRLHKFGAQDKRYVGPSGKSPSFLAMCDLATDDDEFKRRMHEERTTSARADFDEGDEDPMEAVIDSALGLPEMENPDWMLLLQVEKRGGNYSQTIDNVKLILQNDISFRGKLGRNLFSKFDMIRGRMPWENKYMGDREWRDDDDALLRGYMEKVYGITGQGKILDGKTAVMVENAYHPVRQYLEPLVWDGKPRLDTLLVDFLGAVDSPYTRAVTRKTFCGAIARIYRPGIKFDTMLVLVGPQGRFKSTLADKMGGEFYSDSFGDLKNRKDAIEQIQGVWIMEIPELAAFQKAEVEEIKHFVSKRTDSMRAAFGRNKAVFPRECIFMGTSNNLKFIKDQTGGRRFWPVVIGEGFMDVNTELDAQYRAQVWAEAKHRWEKGEKIYLDNAIEIEAKEVQADHTEQDPRTEIIPEYLDTLLPQDWYKLNPWERRSWFQEDADNRKPGTVSREKITIPEIWVELFGGNVKEMSTFNVKFIRDFMNNHPEWERSTLRVPPYGLAKGFKRKIGNMESNTEK